MPYFTSKISSRREIEKKKFENEVFFGGFLMSKVERKKEKKKSKNCQISTFGFQYP
jgi:hypothetical protein